MISTFDDHPQPATIQIPTGQANGEKRQVAATVKGMEGKRLVLESVERVGISTAISVECNDALFLGEVVSCRPSDEGDYRVELFVEQILTGLQSLVALRAGLLGDSVSQPQRAMAHVNVSIRNANSQ